MPKLDATPEDSLSPLNPTGPSAAELLNKFLLGNITSEEISFIKENHIELRLTPPIVRQIEAGGLMIDQSQIIANFKQKNSIDKN